MLVQTSRFGQIESSQEEILVFPGGLIGFENARQWIILPDPENSDVAWLQSVTEQRIALPVISPRKFVSDYKVGVTKRQLSVLSARNSDRIYVLSVVSKSGKTITMNLKSPLIINLTKRLGCQIISSDALPLAMPIELDAIRPIRMAA
ncbi:MAG: flagellar assembly protein FliW [Aureliella sp.]